MIETLLTALSAIVSALKIIPGVAGEVATWISVVEHAVANAISAHQKAKQAVDPAQLNPIEPV